MVLTVPSLGQESHTDQNKYTSWLLQAEELKDEDPERSQKFIDQILQADSSKVAVDIRVKALQMKATGEMYNYQFEEADKSFKRAFALIPLLETEKETAIIKGSLLLDIGRNFNWQSRYDTALTVMIQSKEVYESAGYPNGMAQALNAIAIMYIQYSSEPEKALLSFEQALRLHFQEGDTSSAARVMQNIGQIHNMIGQNDSALYYLRVSNKYVDEKKDFRSLAVGTNILGAVFLDLNQLDSSEYYFRKAIELDMFNQDSVGLLYDYSQLATTLIEKQDYDEAEKYSRLAFENTKDIYIKSESAEALSKIYEYRNQPNKSLAYYKSFKSYADSIRNQDQQATISELQTKYETVEKEKEIELAKVEIDRNERFQNFLFVIIGLIVLFSFISIALLVQRFKLKRALLSQEIDTLRAQINAVFGINAGNLEVSLEEINDGLHRPLTEREYEVLNQAISNKNNGEIADAVYVSVNTVKTHLKNIYTKLGVSNRKEALQALLKHNQ